MIKPPGRAGVSLEVSDVPSQLIDIPASLYHLTGIVPAHRPPEGLALFGTDVPAGREVHVYLGYRQTDEHGRFRFLGRDFKSGELNHFSFRQADGWKRHANVPVTW